MRKPTLTHVTLNTVEQCRSAATQVVKAYRLGGHRVIGKVKTSNERVNTLTQLAAKGVDQVADRSEQLIDISAKTTATQISKAAKFANSIDNPVLANGLQTASRLSLPSALAVLAVAGKAAAGADSLVKAVEVKRPARKARAAVKPLASKVAKKVVKAAKAVAKPAAKPVRKAPARRAAAPAAVVAPVVAKAKRVRVAAKQAVEAVAATAAA
ncbi:hypothetical protein ABT392_20085 [Paucibacter sp. JuS9]|uniref:hypothetical protein n=1 Tax=Paucibacter sp. JuS9 TaxID=3228748 RepID=UPI003757939F